MPALAAAHCCCRALAAGGSLWQGSGRRRSRRRLLGDCRACKVNTNQPTTHPPKPPAPRGWLPKPLRPGHAIVQKLGLDEVSVCGSRGALIWKNDVPAWMSSPCGECRIYSRRITILH
ncbi:uncharacterized protein LOC110364013 isoform X2 [Columba livia]|uniref:uncharacterized protein LOC110364013 isoform X2 n=1 Tax=Columba livia TaxID=8932 RepID=UPI0031BA5BD4